MERKIEFNEYVSADNIFRQVKDTQYLYIKGILDKIYNEIFIEDDKFITKNQALLKSENLENLSVELIDGNKIIISEFLSEKILINAIRETRSGEYIIEINKGIYLGKVLIDFDKADVETINNICKEINKYLKNENLEIVKI